MAHALESLKDSIRRKVPEIRCTLDVPVNSDGSAFLDLTSGDYRVVVEWRKGKGFGISAPPDGGLGQGPDEVYKDSETALKRVLALLKSRTRTFPQREISLRELRDLLQATQAEVAGKLGVTQANVSKLEHSEDPQISTIRAVVESLGGELKIVAQFKAGRVHLHVGPRPRRSWKASDR